MFWDNLLCTTDTAANELWFCTICLTRLQYEALSEHPNCSSFIRANYCHLRHGKGASERHKENKEGEKRRIKVKKQASIARQGHGKCNCCVSGGALWHVCHSLLFVIIKNSKRFTIYCAVLVHGSVSIRLWVESIFAFRTYLILDNKLCLPV